MHVLAVSYFAAINEVKNPGFRSSLILDDLIHPAAYTSFERFMKIYQ